MNLKLRRSWLRHVLPVALIASLALCLLPRVAAAAAPSAVSFSVSNRTGGATATWTVGFTTSATGALTKDLDSITILAPSGTAFPGAPANYTVNGTIATTVALGTGVSIMVPVNVGPNSAVTVVVTGVTNPATGAYVNSAFDVHTSTDLTDAFPAAGLNFTGTVTGVSFAANPPTGGATSTWTVGFTTSAGGALGTADTIFISMPGTGRMPSGASNYKVNGVTATTVVAPSNYATITVPASIGASTAVTVVITGVTNPPTGDYSSGAFQVTTSQDTPPAFAPGWISFGGPVSGVSFSPSPAAGGETSTWTVDFTTSSGGAVGSPPGSITVTAPSGTVFPATAGAYAVQGIAAGIVSAVGNTATITVPASIGNSTPVRVTIGGVTNPATGAYANSAFSVSTSTDTTAANPSAGFTFTGSISNVTFTADTMVGRATATWTVGFTTSAGGALGTSDVIYLAVPAGAVVPNAANQYTVAGVTATTVSAGVGYAYITVPTSIGNSAAVTVVITGVTNPGPLYYSSGALSVSTSQDRHAGHPPDYMAFTGSVSSVSFSPSPAAGGGTSTWTVGFTTSAGGPLYPPGTITVTAPSGTVFPATAGAYTVDSFSASTVSAANNTVTITVPATISNALPHSVVITGVTNPAGGTYPATAFAVHTSMDTPNVNPAAGLTFASSVSNLTFTPGHRLGGRTATWTVGFSTSSAGALSTSNSITLSGPAGLDFPTAGGSYTVNGTTPTTVSASGNTVAITVPAGIGTSQPVSVVIAGVTNPGPNVYASNSFSAMTSKDTAAVVPAAGLTFTGSPSGVAFTPSAMTGGATADWAVAFTTSAGGPLSTSDTISIYAPSGTAFPAAASHYKVGGSTAPTVSASGDSVTIAVPFPIGASHTVPVVITGVTNPPAGTYAATTFHLWTSQDLQMVGAGSGITFTAPAPTYIPPSVISVSVSGPTQVAAGAKATYSATALDRSGSPVGTSLGWNASVGTIGSDGNWTAPTRPGTYTVTAFASGVSGTRTVTVVPGPAATVRITPAGALSVRAGETLLLQYSAADSYGNALSGPAWTVAGVGSISDGAFRSTATGAATVTVVVGGISASSGTITVTPAPAATVRVQGSAASVAPHGRANFTATVADQYGNAGDGAAVTWSASGGSIDQTGAFTAGSPTGTVTVTATVGGASGTGTITVTRDEGSTPPPVLPVTSTDGTVGPSRQPAPAGADLITQPVTVSGAGMVTVSFNLPVAADGRSLAYYYDARLKAWIAVPTHLTLSGATAVVPANVPVVLMRSTVSQPADSADHWANAYLLKLASLDLLIGFPDGSIRPDEPISRYQLARVLALAAGLNVTTPDTTALSAMSDASSVPEWARPAVAAVLSAKLMVGAGAGFDGNGIVTRAQAAAVIGRLLGGGPAAGSFPDSASIPEWAQDGVARCVATGIISGFADGSFRPDEPLTRGQMAKLIALAIDRIAGQ